MCLVYAWLVMRYISDDYPAPVPREEGLEQPVPREEVLEQPVPTEHASEQPVPRKQGLEQPVPTEHASEQPVPRKQGLEQPVPTEHASEQPVPSEEVLRSTEQEQRLALHEPASREQVLEHTEPVLREQALPNPVPREHTSEITIPELRDEVLDPGSAEMFTTCPTCNQTNISDILQVLSEGGEMADIFYNFGLEDELKRSLHGVSIHISIHMVNISVTDMGFLINNTTQMTFNMVYWAPRALENAS